MTSQSHMNQGPEDEREQEARKIVQISTTDELEGVDSRLFGLDNRGDVWELSVSLLNVGGNPEWSKLPPLPES